MERREHEIEDDVSLKQHGCRDNQHHSRHRAKDPFWHVFQGLLNPWSHRIRSDRSTWPKRAHFSIERTKILLSDPRLSLHHETLFIKISRTVTLLLTLTLLIDSSDSTRVLRRLCCRATATDTCRSVEKMTIADPCQLVGQSHRLLFQLNYQRMTNDRWRMIDDVEVQDTKQSITNSDKEYCRRA